MFQDITVEECLELRARGELTLVDVRSPSEFRDASIPGSLNIPIFDDRERAEIGTIYKQVSVAAAKERGLEIVSAKLPAFVKQFAGLPNNKAVFCWRGGMRSKTTATVLSLMGIRVYRISGGYRAYRQFVVDQINESLFQPRSFILHGNTGSGKTAILHRLKEKGHPVLDLEGMAGHRGSIFGTTGAPPHNQKKFDALLLDEITANQESSYFIFEAESRKIGNVTVPELVMNWRAAGFHILLELPIEARVKQIIQDYKPWDNLESCLRSFRIIKSRIHTPVAAEIEECLLSERFERAVELLLGHYYDPRYTHSSGSHEEKMDEIVKADTVEEAFAKVEEIIKRETA